MTPAPPPSHKDDSVDVNDMLNAGKPEHEGLDPDSLDADFEQELEDLFSDDLEEDQAASDEDEGDPIVLDEYVTVENDGNVEIPDMDETLDPGDDELLLLDDLADDDDQDMAALLEDIAEANEPEPEAGDDEPVIELDDLLDEPADDLDDLDALLTETEEIADASTMDIAGDEAGDDAGDDDILLLDEVMPEPDMEPDALDAALADEMDADAALAQDIPVSEAVPEEALDQLMDEPEDLAGEGLSDLTGLDALEDDMEDMDSLLDNVEVDVSDVMDDSVGDGLAEGMDEALADADISDIDLSDMDLSGAGMPGPAASAAMSLGDAIAREAMPPDAGLDVSDEVDVDQLLADVRPEAVEASLPQLQAKVARLEARVAELESRIRQEIASLLPAEAARIIREEIAALASELDD